MKIREIGISRMIFVKLEPPDDILDSLSQASKEFSIKTGYFTGIGAVNQVNIGYYQVDRKEYKTLTLEGDFEIVACIGNITQKDKAPLIHAHLVVADKEGHAFGGHLLPGCQISVTGEVFIIESKTPLIRKPDDKFHLSLIHLD